MLTVALAAVALVAGLAGAWSPCGLSMVETLAPEGYAERRRTAAAGALAFALGALAGGAATFGGLAVLGAELGAGGGAAAAVAVAALLAAAAGDAAGRRIVPQVRRQVPESWRRVLPLPLASGLYGVLLGLGFTTFLLSFATWGLAAACLAVGTPLTGLVVGLAFGTGRLLPVVVLAPLQHREVPAEVAAAMAERPEVLRGLRAVAAAGLALAAVLLLAAPPPARAAAELFTRAAADPSASGDLVAWRAEDGSGRLLRDGQVVALPGARPAVAAGRVAYLQDGNVVVADAATLVPILTVPVPDADSVGLSESVVTWRQPFGDGRDAVYALRLRAGTDVRPSLAGVAQRGGTLSRPVAIGNRVVFSSQSRSQSRVLARNVANGRLKVLRRARGALLIGPSVDAGRLLYVRSTARRQELRLGRLRPRRVQRDTVVHDTTPTARRDAGRESGRHDHRAGYPGGRRPPKPPRPRRGLTVTLWTTALGGDTAYVTRLRHRSGGVTKMRILKVGLQALR